jgi:hypothetical protein
MDGCYQKYINQVSYTKVIHFSLQRLLLTIIVYQEIAFKAVYNSELHTSSESYLKPLSYHNTGTPHSIAAPFYLCSSPLRD